MRKDKRESTTERIPCFWPDGTSGMLNVDPFGSYTGLPEEPFEKPVQDADDL